MPDNVGPGREFQEPDGIKVISRVGVGRRSQWFQAKQVRLDRTVAIKFLRPFLSESFQFRESFLSAGRQAAVIVHPASLPIINVYPNQHCIAMQWCRGTSLKELEANLDPVRMAIVADVVMDCLASLHATGRCHGNLVPGNIFLAEDNGVWVNDFFQPARMSDGSRMFVGEQRFMAPEFISSGTADWRTDVFSLGCVVDKCVDKETLSREFRELVKSMRALDPLRRGESPQAVHETVKQLRRLEESRTGNQGGAVRRKRMYRRVPGEFDVSLRRRSATPDETAAILMKIRDIGESGVFVETNDDLIGVGSILELDFTLKGVEGNVHAFGVVRWKSTPPMPKGVGVQFMEVDQAGLARLRKFLESK